MKTYEVIWGADSAQVQAICEQDAWAKFADGNSLAQKHPHLYDASIKEVEQKEAPKQEKSPKKEEPTPRRFSPKSN